MSVRDPSRRKTVKYVVMAALGLGAGVALGEVTGANRLVHAASPSGSDPVFSGTGIQFPSLTSDPSQLVGNMWYRSDLTAMKYSDGTNAHELAALDIAQTFTAVQTFNGGIVFDAAGSIASTSTYIEADGAGGDMIINVPAGKVLNLEQNGLVSAKFDSSQNLNINGNNAYNFRTLTINSDTVLNTPGSTVSIFHAAGDSYPSAQLGDGFLKFGAGGSTPLSTFLTWTSGGLDFNQIFKAYNNVNTVGLGLPAEYASTLTNAVAIGTTSTVIKTYTPTADGQFLVVVSVEASVASTISSLTVTYTDATSGVSTTQTLATSVAVALNNAVTFTALCNATTASAISVQATALAATDLYASATVFAL